MKKQIEGILTDLVAKRYAEEHGITSKRNNYTEATDKLLSLFNQKLKKEAKEIDDILEIAKHHIWNMPQDHPLWGDKYDDGFHEARDKAMDCLSIKKLK